MEQVPGDGVEGTERFVHQQQAGVLGEGPGQGGPLAHPPGELVRTFRPEPAEVDPLEQFGRRGPPLGLGDAPQSQWELHVRRNREPREERRVLEEHGQRRPVRAGVRAGTSTVPAVGRSRPAIRLSRVVLPHPEAPTRQTNSPGATSSETSWRATTPDSGPRSAWKRR